MSKLPGKRKHSNDIIFTFDALVDIEIGVVRAIIEDFFYTEHTNQYINYDFLEKAILEPNYLKKIRMMDIDKNIVQECFLGKARKEFLDIYVDYISKEYSRIVRMAPHTDMVRLVKMYSLTGFINSTVVCKNTIESEYIKEITEDKCKIKLVSSYEEVDLTGFARVCIANISDILQFRGLKLLNIAVLHYASNFIKEKQGDKEMWLFLPHIVMPLWDINEFVIMNPYRLELTEQEE